jgi:FAD/FMN-containing dehydrogenase
MRQFKTKLSSSNRYPITSSILFRPERYQQLKNDKAPIIARGSGSCSGDASLNTNEKVLLMERLNRFLAFDEELGILTAEAGTTLADILKVFVPRGWFLPVTPSTKNTTLGGCIAVDTQGKNHHHKGSFGKHVEALELILADGTTKTCSPKINPDLFWATIGGMGLTGIISEVSLQLMPIESSYISINHQFAENLEQALTLILHPPAGSLYSAAKLDCYATGKALGRGIVLNGHHASLIELPKKIKKPLALIKERTRSLPFSTPSFLLNPYLMKSYNDLSSLFQRKKTSSIIHYDHFFYANDKIRNRHRLYGKNGYIQYQLVVPLEAGFEALKTLLERISKSRIVVLNSELKRFGKENEAFLSFPKEGYSLRMEFPIKDPTLFSFLDQMDDIVLDFGGRVYAAPDPRLKSTAFRAMYPRLGQWQRIKSFFDPQMRFSSDLSRRLKMEQIL